MSTKLSQYLQFHLPRSASNFAKHTFSRFAALARADRKSNVFGMPINEDTPDEHSWKPTRMDLARQAFNSKNSENKYSDAIKFVEKLRTEYGNGVCTLCAFYNATGGPLEFVYSYNWEGHIWISQYPAKVENGPWGAFLHAHPTGARNGSSGFAVYRGKNQAGVDKDWLFSWSNPWKRAASHKTYCETREIGHYQTGQDVLDILEDLLEKSEESWSEECDGCASEVMISDDTPVVAEAIFTLTGVDRP